MTTTSAERVTLVDVTTRDGLQDEPYVVATARKAEIVAAVAAAGIAEIEATSFVHPAWVPQLRDAEALIPLLPRGVRYLGADPERARLRSRAGRVRRRRLRAGQLRPGLRRLRQPAPQRVQQQPHDRARRSRSSTRSLRAREPTRRQPARRDLVQLRLTLARRGDRASTRCVEMVARFEAGGCASIALGGHGRPSDARARRANDRGGARAQSNVAVVAALPRPARQRVAQRRGRTRVAAFGASKACCRGSAAARSRPTRPATSISRLLAAFVESRGFATGTDAAKLAAARGGSAARARRCRAAAGAARRRDLTGSNPPRDGAMTESQVELLIGLLVVAIPLVALARRAHVSYPIVLVLGGLLLGFVPGLPRVQLDPNLVLLIFFRRCSTGKRSPRRPTSCSANPGQIAMLAVGLVFATTVVGRASWCTRSSPGMPWAVAFVLGAIVAPTDELASAPVLERLKMPRHLIAIVEGESLVNDALSLVLLRRRRHRRGDRRRPAAGTSRCYLVRRRDRRGRDRPDRRARRRRGLAAHHRHAAARRDLAAGAVPRLRCRRSASASRACCRSSPPAST